MNTYSYKRAGPEDIELVRQLRGMFAVTFDDESTWNSAPPSDAYLATVLKDKNHISLMAIHDDEVVGGIVAYVLPKIEQERSEIYLYDLAVDEKHRRRGIATRLIEELKVIGKEAGAQVIFVQADNVDAGAVAPYTKLCDSKESDITHFDIKVG